ncbi:MAG: biopolymer transporter ExbD [Deltaproteobacteria bacterium]|nr:biopolymer transporter ExbD [Deltaproteobacteria bacterium]
MAGTHGRGPIVGINVTPMVDVVLVLLVIMMVTATYIVAQSFNVDLPKTSTADESPQTPLVVTLDKNDKVFFNDLPVTEAQLTARLTAAAAGGPDVNLVISADRDVRHGMVMHTIDLAKLAGISKFSLNVERVN